MGVIDELESFVAIAKATTTVFERPDRLPRALAALAPWGANPAGLAAAAGARYPNRVAFVDDDRQLTYGRFWDRVCRVRGGLERLDVGVGDRVGVMMRNHIGFCEAVMALAAAGADIVLLNTGFAAPQLAAVAETESLDCIVHDDEFASFVAGLDVTLIDEVTLEELARSKPTRRPNPRAGSVVILTSGTTGRPKGAARRSHLSTLTGVGAVLERVPLRLGDVQYLAAPMFHAWGFSNLLLGVARCATSVVAPRFDPTAARRAIDERRARVLIVVPVMLHRLHDTDPSPMPSIEVIAASGSALHSGLVGKVRASFGDVLYNLYGSTEVSAATIATPDELAAHPDTAGRPALGVTVRILDRDGNRVPDGKPGRIFVGSASQFDGYTGEDGTEPTAGKETVDGLLSTGDLGTMADGLLYVDGREDDMIVSGGENVYPGEVEHLLSLHPDIAEVAVIGVPDPEFGQVMEAFVVAEPGSDLRPATVRRHVKAELARHKVPRRVTLVASLPRNETGKVLKSRLADPATTPSTAHRPSTP